MSIPRKALVLSAIAAVALLSASCSALVDQAPLDANGCRPAMAIYQPPMRAGGAGGIINVPANCAPTRQQVQNDRAAVASTDIVQDSAKPALRIPAEPVPASAAIRNGVVKFCSWFFGDEQYSLPGLQRTAFDAGFSRGSSVDFAPLPEMLEAASFSKPGIRS